MYDTWLGVKFLTCSRLQKSCSAMFCHLVFVLLILLLLFVLFMLFVFCSFMLLSFHHEMLGFIPVISSHSLLLPYSFSIWCLKRRKEKKFEREKKKKNING